MEASVKTDLRGYAKIKKAAEYAGISERSFRGWLKCGLRHIRLKTGTILIAYDAIDEYLSRFEISQHKADEFVEEIMKEFSQRK